ncbi:hypothetical protein ACOMHN_000879 [Nucella lapillus]
MKPQSAAEQKTSIDDIRGPYIKLGSRRASGRPRGRPAGPKQKSNWSKKTHDYIKLLTAGKGAPCRIWAMKEKRALLQGLQKYSHQDWDSLCKLIPSRTKQEIQEYIYNLRGGEYNKNKPKEDAHLTWAPIESWLDMSSEMVHYEQIDLSGILGRVFSIIGHFENSPPTTNASSEVVPDYGKLYRYIAAIMDESLTLPDLTPLESALIADLMHGLGDSLRMSDTSLQRKVMCWKYKMLNYKFEYDDVRGSLDRIRKALTNDFSDLQRDNSRGVSRLPSFTQGSSSNTATEEAAAASPATPASQPEGAPSTASTTHHSGAPDGEMSPPTASQPGAPAGLEAAPGSDPTPGPSSASDSLHDSPEKAAEGGSEEKPKRKRGRPRLHNWRRPLDKPRLFTMNPFCVPIRLLRLKSVLAGAAASKAGRVATQRLDSVCSIASVSPAPSVSSVPSVSSKAGSQLLSPKDLSVREEASKAEVTDDLRQVTGLYESRNVRSYKKRDLGQSQVSGTVKRAISEVLAKRSQRKGTVPSVVPPGGVSVMVQGADTGHASSIPPSRSFRCIPLHDGNIALVPLHLRDTSALSQVQMKHAMPVPKCLPTLKPCPTVQKAQHQHVTDSSPTVSITAPRTTANIFIDTSHHEEEGARSDNPSIFARASSSGEHFPSSVCFQRVLLPARQTSESVGRQSAPAAQRSVHTPGHSRGGPGSQEDNIVRLTLAPPTKLAPPPAKRETVQPSTNGGETPQQAESAQLSTPALVPTQPSVSAQLPETAWPLRSQRKGPLIIPPDPDSSTMQLAQIIPRKRKRHQIKSDDGTVTTTEILVTLLPNQAVKTDPAPGDASRPGPSKAKQKKQVKLKAPRPKAGKTSDAKTSSPKSKTKMSKPKQSKNNVVTSETNKPQGVKGKNPGPKRKPSTVQSAGPPAESESSAPTENGDGVTLQEESSPGGDSSGKDVPGPAVKDPSRAQAAVTGQAPSASGDTQVQSSQPPAVGQTTQQPPKPVKSASSFKRVLQQPLVGQKSVPSTSMPPTSMPQTSTDSSQHAPPHTVVSVNGQAPSEKNKEENLMLRTHPAQGACPPLDSSASTNHSHAAQPPPSSSSSSSSQPYVYPTPLRKNSHAPKSSPGSQEPNPPKFQTLPALTVRGRPRKTEPADNSQPTSSNNADRAKAAPVERRRRKKGEEKEPVARKRPSNFLAYEDISKMDVEIVTPEDSRGRLLASLHSSRDHRTQQARRGRPPQHPPGTPESLDVVVDEDSISLVSI